jgi:hypothetical protein
MKLLTAFISTSIFVFLTSCSIITVGKKGVFLNEMGKAPLITTYDFKVVLMTSNSTQNSSLSIYKIDYQIDTIKKQILLKGYQAFGKKYKDIFEISFSGLLKSDLDKFEFFWMDPDKTLNKLTNNNNETLKRTMP